MADILTLAQAREALGWKEGQNPDRDANLTAQYIPATTRAVENFLCRRWADYTATLTTSAPSPITTPWADGTLTVKAGTTTLTGWTFVGGVVTITDPLYTAGSEVTITATALTPFQDVVTAAGAILAQLWNADHQGLAAGSLRADPTASTPTSFAVPRRAAELLAPYSLVTAFA